MASKAELVVSPGRCARWAGWLLSLLCWKAPGRVLRAVEGRSLVGGDGQEWGDRPTIRLGAPGGFGGRARHPHTLSCAVPTARVHW